MRVNVCVHVAFFACRIFYEIFTGAVAGGLYSMPFVVCCIKMQLLLPLAIFIFGPPLNICLY